MTQDSQRLSQFEIHLGWLLVTGVMLSAASLALGLVLLVLSPASPWPPHLLSAGLMILMATPMLRVVLSIVEYVRMREWLFVATTVVVLAQLAAGVFYAMHR